MSFKRTISTGQDEIEVSIEGRSIWLEICKNGEYGDLVSLSKESAVELATALLNAVAD